MKSKRYMFRSRKLLAICHKLCSVLNIFCSIIQIYEYFTQFEKHKSHKSFINVLVEFSICRKKNMHRPGIEPGPPAWQASILPLNHRC